MSQAHDVVIVGGGIAGGALATVLARQGIAVAVLERELAPTDKVRGEYMAPWGVAELKRLGLLDPLLAAGGLFATRTIPYDENMPGDAALPFTLDLSTVHPQAPGSFCMSHPAMCATLATAAEAAGAAYLRGVEDIVVSAGSPPTVAFSRDGVRTEWRCRLVIGADGRNSRVRHQLGFPVLADPPHNLLGGLLVEGVPDWPQDTQVIGTEDRLHFLIFPQGGDRVRLYLCYDFADKGPYAGPARRENLIAAFAGLRCLPYARSIAEARPIGPFNSFSNEDHWIEDTTAAGVVLVGDAAGHNDPITGQGLSIALRDVRLVSEAILAGRRDRESFRPYVEERLERMRRLRITARLATTLRAEYGEAARLRRQRAGRRAWIDKMLTPAPASIIGPEMLPAAAFEQRTIDALLAP
jgi:2-polyprenyl-6-methoxyphenol hydroxylase-like FAD-dependent oxidoreductase